jgi:hypothetical protein
VFIAHLRPELCPLGAFAFYHHYIHDVKNISGSLQIDWSVNKSWRQVINTSLAVVVNTDSLHL